jgi:hypothetical protein
MMKTNQAIRLARKKMLACLAAGIVLLPNSSMTDLVAKGTVD